MSSVPVFIHLDIIGGLTAEAFVAAMLDACPDLQSRVLADVAAVGAGCSWEMSHGKHHGFEAARFGPVGDVPAQRSPMDNRALALRQAVERADLAPGTKAKTLALLDRCAEAEGRVRGVSSDDLRLCAVDDDGFIVTMVAAASIAAALPGCAWSVSDLPLGRGVTATPYGSEPVPRSAVALMLRGFRWRDDGSAGERVSLTGASILSELAASQRMPPDAVLSAVGIGAEGTETAEAAGLVRALVFDGAKADALPHLSDEIIVLSFDVDDMTGEEIGMATDQLRRQEGVIDIVITSLQGKKGRPASGFRLLVRPEKLTEVVDLCFLETSTIGMRWHKEWRYLLPRQQQDVVVDGQILRCKRVTRPGGLETVKVESDDVAGLEGLARRRVVRNAGEHDAKRR